MEENKFWLGIWALLATVIIACTVIATVAAHLQRQAIIEMVKNGADPMAVSCSFGVGQSEVSICTLLATKEKK